MRVPLSGGMGVVELIDEDESDWRHTPVCQNAGAVARLAFSNDRSPNAARVRALVANALVSADLHESAASGLLRVLEAALGNGSIRLTSGRTSPLHRLAPYIPPAKPAKAVQPAPRVGKPASSDATPEESTEAEAECLEEASRQGAAFVE